jgi:hypothetical protein
LNTKVFDDFEKARIFGELKANDEFYKKKYQFFVEAIVEEILDNASIKHRPTPEDFYFSPEFLHRTKAKLNAMYNDMYYYNAEEKLYILYDDLMFESFDQTINDIMIFFKFELLKKIERKKKKKKKKYINYKHLNVQNPSILKRIN